MNGIVFRHRCSRHVVDLSRRREFLSLIDYHVTDRRHHFILDCVCVGICREDVDDDGLVRFACFSCVELSRWRRRCVDFIIVVLRNGDDLFFTSRTCTCEMSSDPNSEIRQCGIVGRISKATFEILFFLNDPKFPISMREMTISTRWWTLSHPGIRVGIVCF